MKMTVKIEKCPEELLSPVKEILSELSFTVDECAEVSLTITEGDCIRIGGDSKRVEISYTRKNELFRALTHLSAFLRDGKEITEKAKYTLLCYMADESRNAVNTVGSVKQLVRYLAMMGYNSMMLYTEDTFELPGYEFFGFMRGGYTREELREIDDYAFSFGIEVIPCVQTLAHLSMALRWPAFSDYKDNGDTLLVGDERTYAFIRAVLEYCQSTFRSRRIHIGMDEAVNLGRGEYLTRNGYRDSSMIMVEHLERVLSLCRELGYAPMMWSDTFFREAFGTYYVKDGKFSDEVVSKIPKDVEMVYWDYYHDDEELLDSMMKLHTDLGTPTVFAGGVRKWDGFATNNHRSLVCSAVQLDYCEKYGVDQIIVTAWGDCGAEASLFSALAGSVYFAERCYSAYWDDAVLNKRAIECFGLDFETLLAFDLPNVLPRKKTSNTINPAKYLLFNDPFERLYDRHMDRNTVNEAYRKHAQTLHALKDMPRIGYALETLACLCDVLSVKSDMGWRLYDAYHAGNKDELAKIAGEIPGVISDLDCLITAFRKQWYKENKTYGFTVQELRLGGVKERMNSIKLRLLDYVSGVIDDIPELECEPLVVVPNNDGHYIQTNYFAYMYTASNLE